MIAIRGYSVRSLIFTKDGILKDTGEATLCSPFFKTTESILFCSLALKQIVMSISGLYLSSTRSMLLRLIKLKRAD